MGELRGIRYEALVPATLDLAERARLAINGVTGPTDPDIDCRVYWQVSFRHNPPVMYHEFADIGIQAKFMEAVPRMRLMSGSDQGREVEQTWRDVLLRLIGPDGLLATPLVGYRWLSPTLSSTILTGFSGYRETDQLIETQINGLMLGAIATYAELGKRELWEQIGRNIVDGMSKLTVSDGDTAYFHATYFLPGEQANPSMPRALGTTAAFAMWPASRFIHFYRATGYEPVL